MSMKTPKKEHLDEVQVTHRMVRAFIEKHETSDPNRDPDDEAASSQPEAADPAEPAQQPSRHAPR